MTRGAGGCGEFCAGPGSSHKWGYASASLMRRRCTVLMCAVRAAICVTLNVSRDSSQPFCVGQSVLLEEFQVAPCLVCLGTNDQISPGRCCWCWC